jgi:hypothetical protein
VGCDDTSSKNPSPDQGTKTGDMASSSACGHPGDTAVNSTGLGAYCNNKDTPCAHDSGKTAVVCTDGVAVSPPTSFCSLLCTTDTDCGANGTCMMSPFGKGCVPNRCLPAGTP